ncbi:MAG: hypothetical protein AB2L09_01815 [Coriobacteriia bacterium]
MIPFSKLQGERYQLHETRMGLYRRIERLLGRPIVAYYTSSIYPVMMTDDDADVLESALQSIDVSKGVALLLSSRGGDGLAAERMINMCRNYSETGEYWVIVPGKAKSAATMLSLGASEIIMSPNSELGPIDPQWGPSENGVYFSLCNVVSSYRDLFNRAVAEGGNLEPYLQQLQRYDEREIVEFERWIELSGDIATRALSTGMMKECGVDEIRSRIAKFLTPDEVKTHGRAIYPAEASECGLNIRVLNLSDALWKSVYELDWRLGNVVSTDLSKIIETGRNSFGTAADSK